MIITQVYAYANWPDESFEVWKWFESNKSHKEIAKNIQSLFVTVFPKIVSTKTLEDLKSASRTIGRTDVRTKVSKPQARLLNTVSFAHYSGICLDKKRLQYFSPIDVFTSGTITIDHNNLKIKHEKVKKRSLTDEEEGILSLRKHLMDDPKRIRADRLRGSLGKEWNYLFDWKESFDIGKPVQKVD